jgi:hypothetical protein
VARCTGPERARCLLIPCAAMMIQPQALVVALCSPEVTYRQGRSACQCLVAYLIRHGAGFEVDDRGDGWVLA